MDENAANEDLSSILSDTSLLNDLDWSVEFRYPTDVTIEDDCIAFYEELKESSNAESKPNGSIDHSSNTKNILNSKTERNEGVRLRVLKLEDQSSTMLNKGEFLEAAKVLKELYRLEGSDELQTSLKIAECEMHLERGAEGQSLQRVKDVICNSKDIFSRFPSTSVGFIDAREIADNLSKNGLNMRALILLCVAIDAQKPPGTNDDRRLVEWLHGHIFQICRIMNRMARAGNVSCDIVRTLGLPSAKRLLDELRAVKIIDSKLKALIVGTSCGYIADTMLRIGDNQTSRNMFLLGLSHFEEQFGVDSLKHKGYGHLLFGVALAVHRVDQNFQSDQYYNAPITAYKKALNFETEEEREVAIETVRLNKAKSPIFYTWAAASHIRAGEYQEAIVICQKQIERLEKEYQEDAAKYKWYGMFLHNLGWANHSLSKYSVAEACYVAAIKAFDEATDYVSLKGKRTYIKKAATNLHAVRREMKGPKPTINFLKRTGVLKYKPLSLTRPLALTH